MTPVKLEIKQEKTSLDLPAKTTEKYKIKDKRHLYRQCVQFP